MGAFGPVSRHRRRPLSVLLLCDDRAAHANTIHDHIGALCGLSRHTVRRYNPVGARGRFLDLDAFDVVVIHYSVYILGDHHLPPLIREAVRAFAGLKVQMIQDDYRLVDQMTARMREIGISLLFTLVPDREIEKVWTPDRLPGVRKVNTLAGYVPEELCRLPVPPYEDRPLDIGYRGRELPFWIGRLGQEKVWLGEGVLNRAPELGLVCDIAWREQDRIYGADWIRFLTSCKATLVSESGATITDYNGSVEQRTRAYLAEHPDAAFEEVFDEILAPYEGNVMMNVISPRVFEAIALRTALVMFPGEYSGAVVPDRHYIALAKDFSNLGEVARRLRDVEATKAMIGRAYDEVAMSGRYTLGAFVRQFDRLLDEHAPATPAWPGLAAAGTEATPRWRRWRARTRNSTQLARLTAQRTLLSTRGRARRRAREAAVTAAIVAKQLREEKPLRRLLAQALVTFRRDPVTRAAALRELQLLHVIRQAAQRRLSAGTPFDVGVGLDTQAHRLTITSAPLGKPVEGVTRAGLRAALASGEFAMAWSHAAVGTDVYQRMSDRWWLTLHVGESGSYEFVALPPLARVAPQALAAALDPLCIPEPVPEAGTARDRMASPRLVGQRQPRPGPGPIPLKLALGSAIFLGRALAGRIFRRAVRGYLLAARTQAERRAVVAAAVRLQAALEAAAHPAGYAVDALHDAGCRRLTFQSRGLGDGPSRFLGDPLDRAPTELVWDHTAVADFVLVPVALGRRVTVHMGSQPYRFTALEPLDAGFDTEAWAQLLAPLAPRLEPEPAPSGTGPVEALP